LILHGVAINDEIYREEPTKTIEMGKAWQVVFNAKHFDEDGAEHFLAEMGDFGEFCNPDPPDIWTYFKVIRRCKLTLPGPDGIPYSAWAYFAKAPEILLEIDTLLRSGSGAPDGFNFSLGQFLPKGEKDGDAREIVRAPVDTRPLSLKNCDNKLVVAANVSALEPQYNRITHKTQNGFVSGRNFLKNILDIDASGRIYSTKYEGSNDNVKNRVCNIPITGAFDYEAAFPSVIHRWIWAVLRHRRLPSSFIILFQAILKMRLLFFRTGATFIRLFTSCLVSCRGVRARPFFSTMPLTPSWPNSVRSCRTDFTA